MGEVKLIPEVRFPSFETNWKLSKLGKLGSFTGGGTPSTNVEEYWEGSIPWVSSSDIQDEDIINIKKTRFITSSAIEESATKLIQKNSILFVSRVGVGKLAINTVELCTSQDFANLFPFKDNCFFIGYYFLSKNKLLHRYAQGTSIKGFTIGDLKSIPIKIPSLPEQQKIAAFLTSIDERIQLLEKKKQGLEEYKKGVMQKIFSQEIRFKDEKGNDYPHWVEYKMGSIGKTVNGLTGKTKVDFGEGKPYIQYMQIFSGSKIIVTDFGYVNINPDENQTKVKYGDVFFTTSSETPNEIGTASVLLDEVDEVYLNSFCFGFRPKSFSVLVPEFAQFLFRSNVFRKKIIPLAQGSTRFNMSKVELMKISILLPSNHEQQKIASFLSSIDDSIEQVAQQIEHSKTYKKGLLQKMFV